MLPNGEFFRGGLPAVLLPAIPSLLYSTCCDLLLYPTPTLTPQALMYVCPNEALAMIVGLGSTFILDLFDGYVIA